uniref:Uncharacterized protein n=1 Tax=Rhodococcus erythropolis TaxID=1833 RepID=Q6XNC7_RHOER|nr:hypothetical protein PBD2.019 [Rhodococcus erythropolis]
MATLQLPTEGRNRDQNANAPPAHTHSTSSTCHHPRDNLQTPSFCPSEKSFTRTVTAAHEPHLFSSGGQKQTGGPKNDHQFRPPCSARNHRHNTCRHRDDHRLPRSSRWNRQTTFGSWWNARTGHHLGWRRGPRNRGNRLHRSRCHALPQPNSVNEAYRGGSSTAS